MSKRLQGHLTTLKQWQNASATWCVNRVTVRCGRRQSCRDQESFRQTVPSSTDAWRTPAKITMWQMSASCFMSAPQPRRKRGRRWKGVSAGRRASTLTTNADVDKPPGLTRAVDHRIGTTEPGRSGSGRRVLRACVINKTWTIERCWEHCNIDPPAHCCRCGPSLWTGARNHRQSNEEN